MKKPVLFTMKMKDEKERELWQKYAKKRYDEPLSVVIRRLIAEDMKEIRPNANIKIEELLKSVREENNQYYKDLISRLTLISEYLTSTTWDFTLQLEIVKGLIFQKIEKFYEKNKDVICTWDSIQLLQQDILKILQEV